MFARTAAESADAAYIMARIGSKLQALVEVVEDQQVRGFWEIIAEDFDFGIARVLPQAHVVGRGGGKISSSTR